MRETLTAQQASFFTRNGYIELEGLGIDTEKLFFSIKQALKATSSKKSLTELYTLGRDVWRLEPSLQSLLTRKLTSTAFALTGKNQLRLGCDQWIPARYSWQQALPCKDLFRIQGLELGV